MTPGDPASEQHPPGTRVLLFVTLRRRDLLPMERIAAGLDARGYETRLSGISDFLFAVMAFRPHVIVFGRCDHDFAHWLRAISGSVVFSLNTEQGGHSKEVVLQQFVQGQSHVGPPALESVDVHLLVDEVTRTHLLPHIEPEKLLVVGYTRLMSAEPATRPRPVSDRLVVGLAGGEAPGGLSSLYDRFSLLLDHDDSDSNHDQGHLAYNVLEWLWMNRLADGLRADYEMVFRPRQGDTHFLLDETGIAIDRADDPGDFFERIDVLLYGRSTLGIEAMMAGVPAVSVARLIEPLVESYGAPDISYVRLSWQPETVEEVVAHLEARRDGELDLASDVDEYLRFVMETYYGGSVPDRSAERIVDAVASVPLRSTAELDLERLFHDLASLSSRHRSVLSLAAATSPKLVHRLVVGFLRWRVRRSKDSYFRAGVFVP